MNSLVIALLVAILALAAPARAQLIGTDSQPGDSCAGYAQGAARVNADVDQDGKQITLICNGTTWGADPGSGGGALNDLSDVATNYTSASMYIGDLAGPSATGADNTAAGHAAGNALTSGGSNTFFGKAAGRKATTGAQNVFVGHKAGDQNTIGTENVFLGQEAGSGNITGQDNIIIGEDAATLSNGNSNVIVGGESAPTLTTGNNNILVGFQVGVPTSSTSNHLNIGNTIYGDVSAGKVGIGTANPQSALHVPDGKYLQAEDNNAGAPPAADCDNDAERGRLSIDATSNRLYVCNGATRGWDYVTLTT